MSTVDLNCFSLIPIEISLNIFSFLSKEDLQNVRFTCNKFKEIISDSPSLLSAFEITHTHLRSLEWLEVSKYSNLKLHNTCTSYSIMPIMMDAVEIISENLLKLDLNSREVLNVVMLQNVLEQCKNLKDFHFVDNGLTLDELEGELPKLKLNLLKVTNQSRIYDLLINSSVKSFNLKIFNNCLSNLSLQRFLTLQKNLQGLTLKLPRGDSARNFFPDEFYETLSFNLRELTLPYIKSPTYTRFLDDNRKTLEKVIVQFIKRIDILDNFTDMPNLRTLDLAFSKRATYPDFKALPQVENLKINAKNFLSICKDGKFPNLKSLDVANHQKMSIFECYKMLINIIVGNCEVIIEKSTRGMDDFLSSNSKFVIYKETKQELYLENLTVKACLKKVRYDEKEIKSEGIFEVVDQIFKVQAVNQRFIGKRFDTIKKVNSDKLDHVNLDECWTEIFTFVSNKDLLALSETCKSFNRIINNSFDHMRRFPVTSNYELDFYREKKYSSLILKDFDQTLGFTKTISVLNEIQDNLLQLEIEVDISFASNNLQYLLQICPNVKLVKIYSKKPSLNNFKFVKDPLLNLPKLNLKYLEVIEATFVLDLFSECSVTKLNIKCENEISFEEAQAIKRFLQSQTQLQSFRIENFNGEFDISSDTKLIKLEIFSCKLTEQIFKFISQNRNSLEYFKINHVKNLIILKYLSFFKNLKELDVEVNFNNVETIELEMKYVLDLKLTVVNAENYNLLKHFPNLTSLSVTNLRVQGVDGLTNLINLKIIDGFFDINIKNPNIKSIILINCILISEKNGQFPVRTNTEEQLDPHEIKILNNFLKKELPSLKFTKLINCSMSEYLKKIVFIKKELQDDSEPPKKILKL